MMRVESKNVVRMVKEFVDPAPGLTIPLTPKVKVPGRRREEHEELNRETVEGGGRERSQGTGCVRLEMEEQQQEEEQEEEEVVT